MSQQTPTWLESTATTLIRQAREDKLGHAPLLQGPVGVGKVWLANALASALLCAGPDRVDGSACGRCHACQLNQNGTHPDCFVVEPAESGRQILVDQVRELLEQLALTPSIGRYRLGVVMPAENMNESAANALLKTLEEPPNDVWLILVSHSPQRLLPTIRSRCQKVIIGPPDKGIGMAWLQAQAPEKSETEIDLALRMSSGAPLLALDKLATGQVEKADLVLDQLHQLALGKATPHAVASIWGEDPETVWPLLAFWISELSVSGHAPASDQRLQELVQKSSSNDSSSLWSAALQGVGLLGTGRRADLLLAAWALEWRGRFKG